MVSPGKREHYTQGFFNLVECNLLLATFHRQITSPLASPGVCRHQLEKPCSGVTGKGPAGDMSAADNRSHVLNGYGRTCLCRNSPAFRNWSISVHPEFLSI